MWRTHQEHGIPRKITQIIKILYDRFKCKISLEGKLSEFIDIRNGVRQGCILSPTLFLLILDRVMKRVKGLRKRGIQWSMKERLEDLDYADDIGLLAQRVCDMDEELKRLKEEGELAGLHINPLNAELNPICYLLALLGVHHFLHISRIRVKSLTFRLLMSYIYIYIYIWKTHS